MVENIARAAPPSTSRAVFPVERAVEAMAELFLVTWLVMCLDRLLTVVGFSRRGPVISQCLTWGIRLLISLPSCGACSAARIDHQGHDPAQQAQRPRERWPPWRARAARRDG